MNFIDDSLTLGLGFPSTTTTTKSLNQNQNQNQNRHVTNIKSQEPSLTLSLSGEMMWMSEKKMIIDERPGSTSGASSQTNNVVLSVKRERETTSSDDVEIEKDCSRVISDEDEDGTCLVITTTRKKLRLTKEQSAMLEENFKLHSTLNPKQKQGLADRLNLRPRQVEVWFQNRRARTKLKQTEVDCEYMKKWCETLTDENRKLQKELQDLKALNLVHPFYMHVPAATLTICPSCDTITAASTTLPSKHFYASAASAPNRPLLVDN